MKKFAISAALLLILLAAVCFPALVHDTQGGEVTETEPTRITSYDADFTVDERGRMQVQENIDVSVGPDRHGIFRIFDTFDRNAPREHRQPHDLTVTRNGRKEPWSREDREMGRLQVAKIGDADRTLEPGVHAYRLSYRLDDVLLESSDGAARLYWNLVPPGWGQPIDTATLQVDLPAAVVGEPRCMVGQGSTGGCTAQLEAGGRRVEITTGPLDPFTPVTLDAELAMPAPAPEHQMPWHMRWEHVLGAWWPGPVLVLLLTLGAAALGWVRSRRTFEEEPGFPLMYAPPEGIGPAQAGYVLEERSTRDHFVGNLLYSAEKGFASLDLDPDGWRATGLGRYKESDPVTIAQAKALGLGQGGSFSTDGGSVRSGQTLSAATGSTSRAVAQWARSEGIMVSTSQMDRIVVIASGVVALLLLTIGPMTMLALVPGAFALFAVWSLTAGAGTRRTPAGRELWSRVGGFRRVLATPSSQDRFDFSGREELYTAYVPWAVAFGCAEEWAAKYRTELGATPPEPAYLGGTAAVSSLGHSVADSFSSAVDSAISSYQATQSSSSSSGGGSSGGGGGGGGGGGSW